MHKASGGLNLIIYALAVFFFEPTLSQQHIAYLKNV